MKLLVNRTSSLFDKYGRNLVYIECTFEVLGHLKVKT